MTLHQVFDVFFAVARNATILNAISPNATQGQFYLDTARRPPAIVLSRMYEAGLCHRPRHCCDKQMPKTATLPYSSGHTQHARHLPAHPSRHTWVR